MKCKKCGGTYEHYCKLCDMFAHRTPPGSQVEDGPIPEDKVTLKNSDYLAPVAQRPKDTWQVSEALAVHPSQVSQANARNKKHGIGTRYDKYGAAHIPSRADRKKLLKLEGFHDKAGGYGD